MQDKSSRSVPAPDQPSGTARLKGASGESKGSRRYDKENLLWQFTVAIRSDPVGSFEKAMIEIARLILGKECEGYGVK